MKKIVCLLVLVGLADCLPIEFDTTAGLGSAKFVEEGNLIEGDIINLKHPSSKNLIRDPSQLWPNKILPYKFSSDFDEIQKFNIETALADLASESCVKFRERTNEPTYAVFKSYGKLCASPVGYTDLRNSGGEVPIYVSVPGCRMRGQIQHEVLHSLGFWHEHTRPDRNEYVTVNWDNIQPGSESNFEAKMWTDSQTLDLPYDLSSVMHYSQSAFSKDGSATLVPKVFQKNANMGQRFRISKLDIAKLNRLYNCDDRYYKGNNYVRE